MSPVSGRFLVVTDAHRGTKIICITSIMLKIRIQNTSVPQINFLLITENKSLSNKKVIIKISFIKKREKAVFQFNVHSCQNAFNIILS
jgi:hypothetical protein